MLLAENDHPIAAGIAHAGVVGKAKVRHEMGFIDAHCRVAVVADVRIVVNIASVIGQVEIVLEGNAIAAAVIDRAGADIGAV